MLNLTHTKVKTLLATAPKSQKVTVKGWVRTRRGNKNVAFIALNDGSVIHNIQIVADPNNFNEELMKNITTGSCLRVTGNRALWFC